MDNIIIEKLWQDANLIELGVTAQSELVKVFQTCYISTEKLQENTDKMIAYIENCVSECYLKFGEKKGNYTPAFSMYLFPADNQGHLKIELDMEIDDNSTRSHRCSFYVTTELGMLETFANKMDSFKNTQEGIQISLSEMER